MTTEKEHKILYEPLDYSGLKSAVVGKSDYITVNVLMDLNETINGNIEDWNDVIDSKVTCIGLIEDISYKIVGVGQCFNDMIIQVTCKVDHIIAEAEEGEL